MTRRPKSTKASRSANMEKALGWIPHEDADRKILEAIRTTGIAVDRTSSHSYLDPLQSPQHRRALREAAKAGIREVVEKWMRMGADPEDVAFALEGQRVEVMAIGRARGKQG